MSKEMKDNRIHYLLSLITHEFPNTGIQYNWTLDEIRIEFNKLKLYKFYLMIFRQIGPYEADWICGKLIKKGYAKKTERGITTLETIAEVRQVYFSKVYKEPINFWILPLNLSVIVSGILAVYLIFAPSDEKILYDKLYQLEQELHKEYEGNQKLILKADSLQDLLRDSHRVYDSLENLFKKPKKKIKSR